MILISRTWDCRFAIVRLIWLNLVVSILARLSTWLYWIFLSFVIFILTWIFRWGRLLVRKLYLRSQSASTKNVTVVHDIHGQQVVPLDWPVGTAC